jgi:hypothetical protein
MGAMNTAATETGALALGFRPSARSVAMAQTGAADPSDPLNSFLNPSLLPDGAGVFGSYFHDDLLSNFVSGFALKGVNFAGMYLFDVGSLAIGVGAQLRYTRLDFPEFVVAASPGAGGRYKPKEEYFGINVAADARWQNGFSAGVGATVKSWSADYGGAVLSDDATADATAFDLGGNVSFAATTSDGWRTTFALGVGVVNIGDDFDDPTAFAPPRRSALPKSTNYGVSVRTAGPVRPILDTEVPQVALVFNADWSEPEDGSPGAFGLGGECAVMQVVFVRAGWESLEQSDISAVVAGVGLGLPSRWFVVRIDYTAYPLELFGNNVVVDKRDDKFTFVMGVPFASN